MTGAPWTRVQEVFQEALEHASGQRAAFLARACAGEPALRREVEALLAADAEAENFIDAALGEGVRLLSDERESVQEEESRDRVGPYRLKRTVGEGGMSTVFLAVRNDDQVRRRVAVKLLKPGMDSGEILRRFRKEQQILASLDHPNIARLFDGGTTGDGRPYFVMEYIEGLPICRYCDRHRLPLAERLRLFRDVCSAVHYAHRNLVVHRDLKPSNVLVTSQGTPKLLDFGIAKLLHPDLGRRTADTTLTVLRPMTPGYASPEQVGGGPITTSSDIYSLGVLLYELLCGSRPYSLEGLAPQEIERVILEEEPERPSSALRHAGEGPPPEEVAAARGCEVRELGRRLRGDLDRIVSMALAKDPGQRYGSVEQLSEDVGRHLEGHPVIARKPTLGYRSAKFVRRNRVAVVAAAAFAALLLAFAASTQMQSAQVARERDKAEQVSAILHDLFQLADPDRGRGTNGIARDVLDRGRDKVLRELGHQPGMQAELLDTLGRMYKKLGLYDEAEPLLQRALTTRRRLLGDDHLDTARSLNHLGVLFALQGDYPAAEPLMREALEVRLRRLGEEHEDSAASLNNLALLLHDQGRFEEAEPLYRQAVALDRKVMGADSPSLATTLGNLALLLYDKGDYAGAEELYREALEIERRSYGERHPVVARSLGYLGLTLQARGDLAAAEEVLREALSMSRDLGAGAQDVARNLHDLGTLLAEQGDPQAEPLLRRALATRLRLLGGDHPEVAATRQSLGLLLLERGDLRAAEPLLRAALAGYRTSLPAGHPSIAEALVGLGRLLARQGAHSEAAAVLRRALEIRRRAFAPGDWRIAEAESLLGTSLAAGGRRAEAADLLARAPGTIAAALGEDHPATRAASRRLAAYGEAVPASSSTPSSPPRPPPPGGSPGPGPGR